MFVNTTENSIKLKFRS